jgi:hypothetical protein
VGLGRDGIAALEKLLALPFQLKTPLGSVLSDDDTKLAVLTQQQFHILSCIEAIPRIAVSGAAGTGKTVLAVEEAKRCAEAKMNTLFTCFNRSLAFNIRQRLNGFGNLTVLHFHGLCSGLVSKAGIQLPPSAAQQQLFDEFYPEALMQAVDTLPDSHFDAVIVDEGQDFLPLWWTAVDATLVDPSRSRLRIFFDSNQRVYKTVARLPEDVQLVPIRLTQNLRNTQRIHETVLPQYEGFPITAVGPEGVPVDYINAEAGSVHHRLDEIVVRLTSVERVAPENIAILVERESELDALFPKQRCGNYRLVNCEHSAKEFLTIDTVRRFKGLESRVVIVVCTPTMLAEKEIPYVAFSRARTHLILVGPPQVLGQLRGQVGGTHSTCKKRGILA